MFFVYSWPMVMPCLVEPTSMVGAFCVMLMTSPPVAVVSRRMVTGVTLPTATVTFACRTLISP
jgi:hypothetical protein